MIGETVAVRPHRWYVRQTGSGPAILCLHGAGSSGASFDRLAPLLPDNRLVVPDLPGHGRTLLGTRQRSGLRHMAEDVARLSEELIAEPPLILAHSAGAAVALEMARHAPVRGIVALNAALREFDGVAGWLFPLLAKALTLNPLAPQIMSRLVGSERRIRDLLGAQGSAVDDAMVAHYRSLATNPRHISGTLAMMAAWDVRPLRRALPRLQTPVLFLAGETDRTVDPDTSREAAALVPHGRFDVLPGLGHLAHEESPEPVAAKVLSFTRSLTGEVSRG